MQDKIVIVTAAASGIGKAISKKFLSSNAKVLMLDINMQALSQTASEFKKENLSNFILKQFDVSCENYWKDIADFVASNFNALYAIINNAGIGISKSVEELSLQEWNKVLATNLTSIFLSAKYCSKFLKNTNGSIVNIASTRALMSERDTEAYSASKGGVVSITHALAVSLAPVRVNCVSPGWIDNGSFAPFREIDHSQHPVGRVGEPRDIANMVEFLADKNLSGFITGQNFYCDGGMTKKMIYED